MSEKKSLFKTVIVSDQDVQKSRTLCKQLYVKAAQDGGLSKYSGMERFYFTDPISERLIRSSRESGKFGDLIYCRVSMKGFGALCMPPSHLFSFNLRSDILDLIRHFHATGHFEPSSFKIAFKCEFNAFTKSEKRSETICFLRSVFKKSEGINSSEIGDWASK